MSTAPDHRRVSLEEYLAWEERSETKHEYYRGEIFAMAGATVNHNRIVLNLSARLHQLLEGRPCEPFASDMRLRVNAVDLSTYPDVAVVCGGVQMDARDKNAIVNPRVIVEVLSESTRNYDLGRKFEFYQTIESLAEYALVEQSEPKVIQYVRQSDGTWQYRVSIGMEAALTLESIDCEVRFKDIYRNVEFEAPVEKEKPAEMPVQPGTPR